MIVWMGLPKSLQTEAQIRTYNYRSQSNAPIPTKPTRYQVLEHEKTAIHGCKQTNKNKRGDTAVFSHFSLWTHPGQSHFLRSSRNGAADVWCLLVSAEPWRVGTSRSPPVCSHLTSCSSFLHLSSIVVHVSLWPYLEKKLPCFVLHCDLDLIKR